jgi:hypothetical protein
VCGFWIMFCWIFGRLDLWTEMGFCVLISSVLVSLCWSIVSVKPSSLYSGYGYFVDSTDWVIVEFWVDEYFGVSCVY